VTGLLSFDETSRFLDTPKGKLHYHVAGDGPPLLLLHGSGPGVSGWANFRGNLPVFARDYTTYVLDHSRVKGLVLGAGVKVQSGVPLTTLVAQQAYQNQGEVPLFGRGDLGRSEFTGTVDAHVEYPWKLGDRFTLKLGFDAFNIANARRTTLVNQNADQGFGVPNPDFQKPFGVLGLAGYFFQQPFSSRFSVRLVF